MRQLTGQGWVHNRARMVVASFLTKHLLTDWREGARFFLQHLVDGDVPSNNGGWQWVAGRRPPRRGLPPPDRRPHGGPQPRPGPLPGGLPRRP
jgi:hypothetical protein